MIRLLLVQGGVPLPTFNVSGETFALVPETFGEYAVRIENAGNRDVLCVLSVDGLNAVSGDPAALAEGGGYVLGVSESIDVPGWRRGNERVAAFTFQPAEGSYAAQMGHGTANVGIVGCAAFLSARTPVVRRHPAYTKPWSPPGLPAQLLGGHTKGSAPRGMSCNCVEPAGALQAAPLGTGYGHEMGHQVRTTSFHKAHHHPDQVVTVRYATRSWLDANGIVVPAFYTMSRPQAFPVESSCPPPPGWTP
jgi:hypothetical protein